MRATSPAPNSYQGVNQSPYQNASADEKEVRPTETGAATGDCPGAPCAPYLRNRPIGCEKNRIKVYNRENEPNWYRYYRCCHYGYHPTQWAPWPEGWLTCRHPQPGPHPYDYHASKPDQKTIDRERRLQENLDRERAEPGLLDEPLPPNGADVPRPLPPENSTATPPAETPPAPAPPMPEALPMPDALPMP